MKSKWWGSCCGITRNPLLFVRVLPPSSPDVLETMLRNMFVGDPPGNYDRLLDYSRAVTGGLFFVPSASMLEELADRDPQPSKKESASAG